MNPSAQSPNRPPSAPPFPAPYPGQAKIPLAEISRARHHLFLCVGPDCCQPEEHAPLWELLKSESRRLSVPILRTKAACLRICREGPWLVVYPEGIWYGRLTPERLQRILHEHIELGRPVQEWITFQSERSAQD